MNPWWFVFAILGCAWIVPLLIAKQAQAGWLYFAGTGCLWALVFLYTRSLYDWGTSILRRIGWTATAEWRERLKPQVLCPVRLALLIMAASSFIFALL